jgi:hypothetical protein
MKDQRNHPRFYFYEPVGYQRPNDLDIQGSMAQDISFKGLRLKGSTCLPLDTLLHLKIALPGQTQFIAVEAKIVWIRQLPLEENSYEMGVELTSAITPQSIQDYINVN